MSEDRFTCPYCQAFSHHARVPVRVLAVGSHGTNYFHLTDLGNAFSVEGSAYKVIGAAVVPGTPQPEWQREPQWVATLCASCERSAVWREGELIYPRVAVDVPAAHPDMPNAAAALYREAADVLPLSRRAAAALARAAMESLLKELAPSSTPNANLQTRIGELASRVNPTLWQVLTALRVVGNDALHDGNDELIAMYLEGDIAETVEPFFGAINALVEELITQEKRAAELYRLIPDSKRDAAERARSDN